MYDQGWLVRTKARKSGVLWDTVNESAEYLFTLPEYELMHLSDLKEFLNLL